MNAVIYARYSSYAQTEQSIDGQLRDCYSFAERQNLTVVGEYIDRAISGRSDDREQFQQMITDAKKKQFEFVIVWKFDRFSRNRFDSAIYKNQLKKHGVRVLSAMENIGDGDESILLEALIEASAEYYSRDLSKKVKRGMRENALKGLHIGATTPLGYRVDNKKLVIEEREAEAVRYAFKQYAQGQTMKKIVDTLNEDGYRNKSGNKFTYHTFKTVFKNQKYIGIYIYDDIEVAGGCPAIIDNQTFEKVQERLIKNQRESGANKAKVKYYLQGKAYCGMCSAPMVGESGRNRRGDIFNYYACADRKKLHTCKKKNERKDFLEWYVVEQTVLYVLDENRIDYIADRMVQKYQEEFNDRHIADLEKQIARIDKRIDASVNIMLDAESKEMQKKLADITSAMTDERAELKNSLVKLRIANRVTYTADEIVKWLRQFCNGDLMDEAFRARIMDAFINSVYLYDDRVIVFYNIKDSKQVSYIDFIDSMDEFEECADSSCSNNGSNGSPICPEFEHVKFVFLRDAFGAIFYRK